MDEHQIIWFLRRLQFLNKCVKGYCNPIRKNAFYTLKRDSLYWLMTNPDSQCYWRLSSIQEQNLESSTNHLAVIKISIGGLDFIFHTPIEGCMEKLLKSRYYDSPFWNDVSDFHPEGDIPQASTSFIIENWEELLQFLEDNNWFIYGEVNHYQWCQHMKFWYKAFNWNCPYNHKLTWMTNNGPITTIKYKDKTIEARAGDLQANWISHLKEHDLRGNFQLALKKNL